MPDVATPYTGTVFAYAQTEAVNASGDGSRPSDFPASHNDFIYNIGGFVSHNGGTTYDRVAVGGPAPATFVAPYGVHGPGDMGNVFQNPNAPGFWYVIVQGGTPGGGSTDNGGGFLWRTPNSAFCTAERRGTKNISCSSSHPPTDEWRSQSATTARGAGGTAKRSASRRSRRGWATR